MNSGTITSHCIQGREVEGEWTVKIKLWRKAHLRVWSDSWGRGGCPGGCFAVNGGLWRPEGAPEVSACWCCTECCRCCLHLRPRLSVWRGGASFWWWRGGARWSDTVAGVAVFRERETRSGREKGCNGELFSFFFLLFSFLLLLVLLHSFFCFKTSFSPPFFFLPWISSLPAVFIAREAAPSATHGV